MLLLIGSVGDSRAVYIRFLLIQIRTNRQPGSTEMDLLKASQVQKFCRKELWVFKDYHRNPEIIDL
jgi:hypothetical protein